MRLAVLTGLYVGVVCSAQIGAQKIIELPFTGVPIDSVVFLSIAFGSLDFLRGQLQAKYAATLFVGLPLVLGLRRLVRQDEPNIVAAQA
jgi:hypothetical protein